MRLLKRAVVIAAAAGAVAVASGGVASADPGTGKGGGNGNFANFICTQIFQVPNPYHGQCVSEIVRGGGL
jgi:hypothetical protein